MSNQAIRKACEIVGGQRALANAILVSDGLVWQWCNGYLLVAPRHYPAIESATTGAVTVAELLSDYYAAKAEAA